MNTLVTRIVLATLAALVLPSIGQPSVAAEPGQVSVSISEVDLDGPVIAPVTVTVTNDGDERLRRLTVTFAGPKGWAVHPDERTWKTAVQPGQSVDLEFQIRVPENRPGFRLRTFTAQATYTGGDGVGSASGTRVQRTGDPHPDLASAYNNVGVTDESDPGPGDFDGDGNSFSAQKLADVGIAPGEPVTALGATFTWPDAAPGTPNNVAAGGQAVALAGQGSTLAFLGSGSSFAAAGTVTVYYSDGTSSTGSLGFPNWSFQEPTAHGATLVASSDGRNRPDGYGNAGIAYRVFANSIEIDPEKTVEFVVLPGAASLHVFDMALVG